MDTPGRRKSNPHSLFGFEPSESAEPGRQSPPASNSLSAASWSDPDYENLEELLACHDHPLDGGLPVWLGISVLPKLTADANHRRNLVKALRKMKSDLRRVGDACEFVRGSAIDGTLWTLESLLNAEDPAPPQVAKSRSHLNDLIRCCVERGAFIEIEILRFGAACLRSTPSPPRSARQYPAQIVDRVLEWITPERPKTEKPLSSSKANTKKKPKSPEIRYLSTARSIVQERHPELWSDLRQAAAAVPYPAGSSTPWPSEGAARDLLAPLEQLAAIWPQDFALVPTPRDVGTVTSHQWRKYRYAQSFAQLACVVFRHLTIAPGWGTLTLSYLLCVLSAVKRWEGKASVLEAALSDLVPMLAHEDSCNPDELHGLIARWFERIQGGSRNRKFNNAARRRVDLARHRCLLGWAGVSLADDPRMARFWAGLREIDKELLA